MRTRALLFLGCCLASGCGPGDVGDGAPDNGIAADSEPIIGGVTDNGDPGISDRFGMRVTAPDGRLVSDLTFDAITLTGGNIHAVHDQH